jgi:phytoene/squalene synthetase
MAAACERGEQRMTRTVSDQAERAARWIEDQQDAYRRSPSRGTWCVRACGYVPADRGGL